MQYKFKLINNDNGVQFYMPPQFAGTKYTVEHLGNQLLVRPWKTGDKFEGVTARLDSAKTKAWLKFGKTYVPNLVNITQEVDVDDLGGGVYAYTIPKDIVFKQPCKRPRRAHTQQSTTSIKTPKVTNITNVTGIAPARDRLIEAVKIINSAPNVSLDVVDGKLQVYHRELIA